jgi:ketosteroid isomerase-like protein
MKNEELIEQFYEGIRESNSSKLSACVHAQFELIWQGSSDIPWSGRWRGVSGLEEFFSILGTHVDVVSISVAHTVSDKDITIAVLNGEWLVHPNAAKISATAANVFAFEDKRIRSYTVINDSEAFAKALL